MHSSCEACQCLTDAVFKDTETCLNSELSQCSLSFLIHPFLMLFTFECDEIVFIIKTLNVRLFSTEKKKNEES